MSSHDNPASAAVDQAARAIDGVLDALENGYLGECEPEGLANVMTDLQKAANGLRSFELRRGTHHPSEWDDVRQWSTVPLFRVIERQR